MKSYNQEGSGRGEQLILIKKREAPFDQLHGDQVFPERDHQGRLENGLFDF